MSKIRVIDLLNKIANGEEVPKKVKLGNIIWNYDEKEKTYFMNNTEIELFYIEKITKKLNDTVEIIEEEPEIDELGKMAGWALVSLEEDIEKQKESINFTLDIFGKKINEIISNQNKIAKVINQINNK